MQLPLWKIETVNPLEVAAAALLNKNGYEVIHGGWPDFGCWSKEKGKTAFVEIKPHGKKLSKSQRRMKRVFNAAGLKYRVWWVGGNGEVEKSPESD